MLKFYNLPLLTAGGFTFDFRKNKTEPDEEYYLMTRTGFDFTDQVKLIDHVFKK